MKRTEDVFWLLNVAFGHARMSIPKDLDLLFSYYRRTLDRIAVTEAAGFCKLGESPTSLVLYGISIAMFSSFTNAPRSRPCRGSAHEPRRRVRYLCRGHSSVQHGRGPEGRRRRRCTHRHLRFLQRSITSIAMHRKLNQVSTPTSRTLDDLGPRPDNLKHMVLPQ